MPYSPAYMTDIMHQLCVQGTLSAVRLESLPEPI
jgi:hypothetical protein